METNRETLRAADVGRREDVAGERADGAASRCYRLIDGQRVRIVAMRMTRQIQGCISRAHIEANARIAFPRERQTGGGLQEEK